MSWQAYPMVFEAKSPIHIGCRKLGFIQMTRHYITGRNMWGAITAHLARTLDIEDPLEHHYEVIGTDILNKVIIASYLYPALDVNDPLLPVYTDSGLKYGSYFSDEFEQLFIRSFGQTAIEPLNNTAEEASLHETEYIAPVIEEADGPKQVYFVGYLFIKEGAHYRGKTIGFDNKDIKLKDVMQEITVGGEQAYGFGRLVLDNGKTKDIDDKSSYLFSPSCALKLDKDELMVEIENKKPIPAHLDVQSKIQMEGDIEPIVGRKWGVVTDAEGIKTGAGQRITEARICWVPGSIVEETKIVKIGLYGMLERGE